MSNYSDVRFERLERHDKQSRGNFILLWAACFGLFAGSCIVAGMNGNQDRLLKNRLDKLEAAVAGGVTTSPSSAGDAPAAAIQPGPSKTIRGQLRFVGPYTFGLKAGAPVDE